MSEYVLKIKEWWGNLKIREKRIVIAGGILLALAFFYLAIWSPLVDKLGQTRQQISANENLLAFMKAADKMISSRTIQSNSRSKVTPVVLMSDIQNKVKESGLANSLTQLKQLSNDTITLHFEKVDFDQTVHLFLSLVKQHSISIVQWSITKEKTPGVVSEDIIVKMN